MIVFFGWERIVYILRTSLFIKIARLYDDQVRAYATITTETIEEARSRHDTLPTASDALRRSMTAGVIARGPIGTMSR